MTLHSRGRHVRRIAALVIAFAIGLFTPMDAGAQTVQPRDPRQVVPPQEWEHWRDPVPVSGGLRVGVMAEQTGRINPVQFTVWLPEQSEKPALCVELSSQDGRYIASLEYDIRGASGPLPLNLPVSRYGAQLRGLDASQLAILARLAKACGKVPVEPGAFVVAGWNRPAGIGDTIIVLLNSRLPTSIAVGDGKRADGEHVCTSLSGTTTAFNLRCAIPSSELREGRKFFIQMRRGGSENSMPLLLAVPARRR
jgi:hypothetical protein